MAKRKKQKTFDIDEHIGQMRMIIADDPTQQNWRKLCEHIELIPDDNTDELSMFVDYAESNIEHWPAALRKPLYAWWQAKEDKKELEVFRLIGNWEGHPLLSSKDVERIAPDRKAITATKKVAKPADWDKFGRGNEALWGEYEGSRDLYYIWVDARTGSFECSCPSRKRPCKHSLAIVLMDAEGAEFPDEEPPSGHRWNAEDRYHGWE